MNSVPNIKRLIVSGQLEAAAAQCSQALEASPDAPELWLLLAACTQHSDPEQTRTALRRAGECAGPEHFREIVDVMVNVRAFDLALPLLERMDATGRDAARQKARCLWGLGAYREAIELSADLLERYPGDAELAFAHVQMAINLGRDEEARRVNARALSQRPNHPVLLAQSALLTLSAEGVEQAWRIVEPSRPAGGFLQRLRSALECLAEGGTEPGFDPHPAWQGFNAMLEAGDSRMQWFGENVSLLAHALAQCPPDGVIVECGVYHGRTISLLAEWAPGRPVYGFDSFEGLPERWTSREASGTYSLYGALPEVPSSVTLIKGWFDRTLPRFVAELDEPVALLHVDCDIYRSTRDVLESLGPRLVAGSIVVFDEYTGYEGWQDHEYRAWQEFLAESGLTAELIAGHLLGKTVAFKIISPDTRRAG